MWSQYSFNCIGQEFQAVFLSTAEPVSEDGNTLNPTKSPCDRYVFNTVLSRAKSLVVVVGSPIVLLKTEQHMVKLYGDKGRCWSLYLKSCIEHQTLFIPKLVEPDKNVAQQFQEQLAADLGRDNTSQSSEKVNIIDSSLKSKSNEQFETAFGGEKNDSYTESQADIQQLQSTSESSRKIIVQKVSQIP